MLVLFAILIGGGFIIWFIVVLNQWIQIKRLKELKKNYPIAFEIIIEKECKAHFFHKSHDYLFRINYSLSSESEESYVTGIRANILKYSTAELKDIEEQITKKKSTAEYYYNLYNNGNS